MHFVDYAKVQLRSGRGGNGCASFRREKFVPRGGPDGGDGGGGGAVLFRGARGKSTLLDFRYRQHYRAGDGTHGKGKDMHGRRGEDLVLDVPLGTVLRDAESGELLLEVLDETPRRCLPGGRGGRGNSRFKSSTHRAPVECEEGQPGQERWVVLELKLIADVGLVGFPNAGKSTLISAVSKARPKIADYPFTTLVPNLGVVQTGGFESFVMADIPGIIEGAHEGSGLGLRFLRHIERTALLLLLIDGAQPPEQVHQEHTVLLRELELYAPGLLRKPRAVALTKADLEPGAEQLTALREGLEALGERVFVISAVSGAGLEALLRFLAGEVRTLRAAQSTTRSDAQSDAQNDAQSAAAEPGERGAAGDR
jgi:GTP-binding protein